MQEETVDMANVVFEERVQQRTVEQGAHMPGVDETDVKIGTENGVESWFVAARNMHMVGKAQRPAEAENNDKCAYEVLGHVNQNRCAERDEFEAIDAQNIGRITAVQTAFKAVGVRSAFQSSRREQHSITGS